MATYGAYKYESPQSRALKSITADSYNKDQAKNLMQLNKNTEYMAGYLRKLQRGVDDANQNILEQAQGFISDMLVLIGGGSATGLDFGDMKYVFQSWGALLGITDGHGNLQLPINLFQAAWHFFSTYVMGFGTNFGSVIDGLIDGAIGRLISWLGDIPIIGGAVSQFAVWVSDLRDFLHLVNDRVWGVINSITGGIGEVVDYLGMILTKVFKTYIRPIIDLISKGIGGPINQALEWIGNVIGRIFNLASGADTKASNFIKKATPLWESLDGNGEVTMLLSTADALMTINSTTARGGFIRCRGGDLKQTISHIAYKTGTVSSYYIDIYRVGLDYSATKIYTTPDLSSALATTATVVFYQMADDDAYVTTQDENYLVVARMTGSGSVTIQGRVFPVVTTPNRPLYPGINRNPNVTASPISLTTADLDAIYVKETPYFQIGTLADIVPQSFYVDFTTISDTLWIYKTAYVSGIGGVNKIATKNGITYIPTEGNNANGKSALIFKYRTTTNRCRTAFSIGDADTKNIPTYISLFDNVVGGSGVYLRVQQNGCYFGKKSGINSYATPVVDTTSAYQYSPGQYAPGSLRIGAPTNGTVAGDWIWLEFDPADGHWRVYRNPNWNNPNNRNRASWENILYSETVDAAIAGGWWTGGDPHASSSYTEGRVFLEYNGNTEISPGVTFNSTVNMDSLTRTGSIVMTADWGGARSTRVDDWILEDWKDPNA